uniref:Uncharacterized protein n=1 Tax=Cucumis melo TaxID=3656 RepID=A0A9I9EB67_CUCME
MKKARANFDVHWSVPVELRSLFGMVSNTRSGCLTGQEEIGRSYTRGKTSLRLYSTVWSRQISVEKNVVGRLHAVFRSKLASSPEEFRKAIVSNPVMEIGKSGVGIQFLGSFKPIDCEVAASDL